MNRFLGLCLGASTVSIVVLKENEDKLPIIIDKKSLSHNGNPKQITIDLLDEFFEAGDRIVFTGRKFRELITIDSITEPEATEFGLAYINNDNVKYQAVASLGGETFIVYTLDKFGKIQNVISKNQCASGTGEFFLQQIKRMGLELDDAIELSEGATPYKVSGRCSVFCKSDCTHALNKAVPKAEVTAGLSMMLSEKIEELLSKANASNVLLTGGVTQNKSVINFIKAKYPQLVVPEEATYFEALGAAYYAFSCATSEIYSLENLFSLSNSSFAFHKPIIDYISKVKFEKIAKRAAKENEKCLVGLDVGSTTTKAVALSCDNLDVLASEYIYTNGDPIAAAKKCYSSLKEQLGDSIEIIGLGTTGSGRHIAGLHAQTEAVFNEITAHSTAALHFDSEVDTIFEIGGQDAKYTYIVNRVPADYAMNEACSAGTGSFIEESAWESLRVKVNDIQNQALFAEQPPNFSDQCSAFISSDIKTAQQEGISRDNILAGLCYSVCLNYVNRVKGNRQIGNKIFMQGGVCYNQAIPIAMAALTGKDIVVPPEPGLMGAFGVALLVKEKIALGLLKEQEFSLDELVYREVVYREPFVCKGGNEKCDLNCEINVIELANKKFPFGGACNKYYSIKPNKIDDYNKYDFVAKRNQLMYEKYAPKAVLAESAVTVGMNNSFHLHSLYPFFYNFFTELGVKLVVPEKLDEKGYDREISSLCFPAQISLAAFQELINLSPDYIFLPSILEMDCGDFEPQRLDFNCTCVFVSGEPHYIKQAFKDYNLDEKIFSPNLNFANGIDKEEKKFIEFAKSIGITDEKLISEAFHFAIKSQSDYQEEAEELGKNFLEFLSNNPDEYAIMLIGRPYNSFVDYANKGIPRKFASRGAYIVPFDIFDSTDESIDDNMFWESGKKILRAAKLVKKVPNLFATYITNFSCAPDSMIINTFRSIMGDKPSLTLELDSHSADAGINTRIEAALDIISNYRQIAISKNQNDEVFQLAEIQFADPIARFITSDGEDLPLNHNDIEILIPSMGDISARLFAAALRSLGFNAKPLDVPDSEVLKYGRANSTGKECLPLQLMVGELMEYIEEKWNKSKHIAFFTVQGAGNCRLGQYPVFIRDLLRRKKIKNVAQMVLMNEDGFAGLGENFALRGIQSIIAADVLDDVRNGILANAIDSESGLVVFEKLLAEFERDFENKAEDIYKLLERFAISIKEQVPARIPIEQAKYIAMVGEIYVRRDAFAHKFINEIVAKKGFILKTAYISEWIFYVDYLLQIDLLESEKSLKKKFERQLRNFFMRDAERKIKKTLEKTGYYKYSRTEIEPLLKHSKHLLPYEFKGEPGLTLGIALHEGLEKYCGIINLGPFGCMPTRLSESIAMPEMNVEGKLKAKRQYSPNFSMNPAFHNALNIPFLTIETDGNVYPQLINAKLESFILQAERIADLLKISRNGTNGKQTIKQRITKFFE